MLLNTQRATTHGQNVKKKHKTQTNPTIRKTALRVNFVTSLPSDTPKELTPTAQAALYLSPFGKSSGARKKGPD